MKLLDFLAFAKDKALSGVTIKINVRILKLYHCLHFKLEGNNTNQIQA